jgi:hypothetical protein
MASLNRWRQVISADYVSIELERTQNELGILVNFSRERNTVDVERIPNLIQVVKSANPYKSSSEFV